MDNLSSLPAFEAGCKMPTPKTIEAGDIARRQAAQAGSENLVIALLRYGATHGLPNISAQQCRTKLASMA